MSAKPFMSDIESHQRLSVQTLEQVLRQALTAHQAGKLREAEHLYQTILASQPNHPTANHNLGILSVQLLQPEAGLPYFRAALDAKPANDQYRISYAKALLDTDRPKDALNILDVGLHGKLTSPIADALRKNIGDVIAGNNPTGQTSLSTEIDKIVVLFNAGYHTEVEKRGLALLIEHPGSGLAWKILGAAQKAQNKEAIAALRKAAELLPDDAEAHFNLGVALEDLSRYTEAETSYRNALKSKPDMAKAHYNLGLTLNDMGRIEEAVASYRKALEIRVDFFDVYNNLGAALASLDKLDEAVASYRQGLKMRPDFAEAHNNLGNILKTQGKSEEAIASYRNALKIKSDFVEAHINLGNTLRDIEQYAEAVRSYRAALVLKPNSAELHNSIGMALKDMGPFEDIVASFRKALDLQPEYAEAHFNLSVALKQINRRESEDHCRKALEINPNLVSALLFSAEAFSDKGQFDKAEEILRSAIAVEPDCPNAWARLASLRKMTSTDTEWQDTAERIVKQDLAPRNEVPLRFALGKYYDDVKNFDQAFLNYRRANDLLKSLEVKYDRDEQVRTVDLIRQGYNSEWINIARPIANLSERPVFIVGMPRSGTSLAEQILASHPNVFGAGELIFWNNASIKHHFSELTQADSGLLLSRLAGDYLQELQDYSADALRVVDKMPSNFMHVGLFRAAFPNCRIIHMQRNPIDTCLSIYFQFFNSTHAYAYDLDDLAHCYKEYLRIMEHWRTALPAGTMLEVPYEALTQDQEGWSRKMIDFIGLPWDDRCLHFDKSERIVGTVSNWQVRQKITRTSVERWRNYEKFVDPLLGLLE